MASALKHLSPISVSGKALLEPQLFENIPMLHWMLTEVVRDWRRAVSPYQEHVDSVEGESAKMHAVSSGFMALQPMFLKCLFSYAFFFVSVDNAYAHFYEKLKSAKCRVGLKREPKVRPTKTAMVKKIRSIRNISVAHFPSDKSPLIDALAAMSWTPMSLTLPRGCRPNLEELTFAPGCFRGKDASGNSIRSKDLEVSGLRTLHQECFSYLEKYDRVCFEYLRELHKQIRARGEGPSP